MRNEGTAREEGEHSPAPSRQDRPLATATEKGEVTGPEDNTFKQAQHVIQTPFIPRAGC